MTTAEYNACVQDYADNVYRFILKQLRHEADAQDVVQAAFEKMWNKRKQVEGSKAKSYLFTTAYHTMIDHVRKTKRMHFPGDAMDIPGSNSTTWKGIPDLMDVALARLPAVQRSAILLRDYEGYSYREIGVMLEISESQTKVYIFRARKALQQYFVKLENVI